MTTPSAEQPSPEQEQAYPGRTAEMDPHPRDEMRDYEGRGLLDGLRALVTGGDSGIGRAVAVAFAKEGADVAIAYLSEQEDEDAARTAELGGQAGRRCVTIRGDLAEEGNCDRAVERAVTELGGLDLLVNNVATQEPVDDLAKLSTEQWDRTFRVNIYSYFWTTRAALRHLPDGGVIINTASINGLRGNKSLIDYAATKGAVLAFTYSLAQALQDREIAHRGLTKLHLVGSMHERKALMASLSDAFIALPGGYGTLDEFFEIVTWAQLDIHSKPCVLINTDGYFDFLLRFLHHAVKEEFVTAANLRLVHVARDSA